MSLQSKIEYSVELLRRAEPLALKMHPDGFHLAFSGGKDSQVLYHLAQMAGVKFKAHMQITTLDPPELMHFVRTKYPDVVLHRPEINFYQLIIKKKQLPLRHARYCCAYLKEQHGAGTCTLIGIRAAESTRRAKRNEVEVHGHKFSGSLDQFNRDREQSTASVVFFALSPAPRTSKKSACGIRAWSERSSDPFRYLSTPSNTEVLTDLMQTRFLIGISRTKVFSSTQGCFSSRKSTSEKQIISNFIYMLKFYA